MELKAQGTTFTTVLTRYLNDEATRDDHVQISTWRNLSALNEIYFQKFIESRKIVEYFLEYMELMKRNEAKPIEIDPEWALLKDSFEFEGCDCLFLFYIFGLSAYCCEVHYQSITDDRIEFSQKIGKWHKRLVGALNVVKDRIFREIEHL